MKTIRRQLGIVVLLICGTLGAQERSVQRQQADGKDNKIIKEVDKINKASEEINATAASTNTAIRSTVTNSKETIDMVGSLFGSGKKKKTKGTLIITIQKVEYDNDYLTRLYTHISKYRGIKNPAKTFGNGQATINVTYKESADALWQSVPKEIRKAFNMVQMDTQSISLQFAGD